MDFSFSYILVGPRSQDVCGQCVEKYASNGNCLEACPVASYAYFYQTGGISCRRCSSKLGLTFNPATNSCQCATGYVNQTGTCNFIAASFINGQSGALSVNTGSGQVTPGSNVVSSPILPPTLVTPTPTSVVTPTPIPNTTITTPIIPSPAPVGPNPNSYVPTVPILPATLPNQVVPQQPTQVVPQQLTPTPQASSNACSQFANSYWTGFSCACQVGFLRNPATGGCSSISFSPKPTTPIAGSIPTCTGNSFYNGVSCVCRSGYRRDAASNCVNECPPNQVYNGVACVCGSGYVLDSSNTCVLQVVSCPANANLVNNFCFCNSGFIKVNDLCVLATCPANTIRNNVNGDCDCIQGYTRIANKNCVQNCPSNETLTDSGACVCSPGFNRNAQGICIRCTGGTYWDGSNCVISCGIQEAYNAVASKCQCNTGYGRNGQGICQLCNGEFFLDSGFCVACPVNSQGSGTTCTCLPGYTLTNGFCAQNCGVN